MTHARVLPGTQAALVLTLAGASELIGETLPVIDYEHPVWDEMGFTEDEIAPSREEGAVPLFSTEHPVFAQNGPFPVYEGEYEEVAA